MSKTTYNKHLGKKWIVTVSILLVTAALLLTGCDKEKESNRTTHLSIILGAHSNSSVLNIESLRDSLTELCSEGGNTVTLILADGQPSVILPTEETEEIPSFRTSSKIEDIVEKRVEAIMSAASQARAKYEESDLLGAISLASRDLQKYNKEDSDRKIIILDTGLQTVAPLDFSTVDIGSLSAESIASALQEEAAIPDLSGVEVIWHMTDTAAPQEELPPSARSNLKEIWASVLTAGSASGVEVVEELPVDGSYEDLPSVSTVPVTKNIVDLTNFVSDAENTGALRLSGEPFLFDSNEATLIDPDSARAALSKLADYMKENASCNALLVGCTAKYGALSSSLTLSYERAKVLENLFCELGIDPNRLRIVGTGWLSSALYQNDQTEDGSLLDREAAQNRCCVWVDISSPIASQIQNDTNANAYIWEQEV